MEPRALPPVPRGLPRGYLSRLTLDGLSGFFLQQGHRPSPAMWDALADLAVTMEAMANEEAPAKLYLSSLDPGVGKTQTIVHFMDCLLGPAAYSHVGILICVARLAEIEVLVNDIGIPANMLAVLTSNAELNALGVATSDHGKAQVMITTQQMVESRLREPGGNGLVNHFSTCSQFHYQGRPRQVRIWDETFLPGATITLNQDDLAFLFKPMRGAYPDLTAKIVALFTQLEDVEDGMIMPLPDFAGQSMVDINSILALFDNPYDPSDGRLKDDQRQALSSLWFLSGKTVTIRKDNQRGSTVIDYRDTLPLDLAPMVILDASGRVRETYKDIEESRGTLVRLRGATKRYDPLTIHLWQVGGGKQAFKDNGTSLISGIARTIVAKPNEQWLVVAHRPGNKVGDIEAGVRKLIAMDPDNPYPDVGVSFLTWGQHMATNDYVNVSNVILAGTLFYRPSFYEALKRLASDRPATSPIPVTKDELDRTIAGEHAHLILQALCRGSVRRCNGDQCDPCDAYVIASVHSGIPRALPDIFPGCKIVRWKPVERDLRGHVKAAVEMIEAWAAASAQVVVKSPKECTGDLTTMAPATQAPTLAFSTVAKTLGLSSQNFRTTVRRHPEFIEAIAEAGIVEWGKGRYFTAFAMADVAASAV